MSTRGRSILWLGLGLFTLAGWCGWHYGLSALWAEEALPTGIRTVGATATEAAAEGHPLTAPLRIAKTCREHLKSVGDYTCRFAKRDVVGGKVYVHTAAVKFRGEPHSVYMRFDGPHQGREVLYVTGRNDGKLVAREGRGLASIVGAVSLRPDSPQAMSESRRPITAFGMANQLEAVVAQWEAETRFAPEETQARYYPSAKLQNMDCQVVETFHPVRRKQFPYYLTRLYVDSATKLPVRVEQYGFPESPESQPPLLEEYTFWDVRPNVGLTDADFDRDNPAYGF